jgi:hypothetical protein
MAIFNWPAGRGSLNINGRSGLAAQRQGFRQIGCLSLNGAPGHKKAPNTQQRFNPGAAFFS